MEEQLISQETFKLARSKGCTLERCICGGFPECICTDRRITQGLLQKWLREKHNIDICVYPVEFIKGNRSIHQKREDMEYTYWVFIEGVKEFALSSQIHDTFENTMEHALERGLQLIK